MTEIVRKVSPLRVEAQEWYPGGGTQLHATEVKSKGNDTAQYVTKNQECNSANSVTVACDAVNQETKKNDDWIKPRKVYVPRNFKDNEKIETKILMVFLKIIIVNKRMK